MRDEHKRGFTMWELLVVIGVVAWLLSIALPVMGRIRGTSGVEQSIDNLVTLGVAHVLYAADWNGRQVTWVVDDLAVYGSVGNYNVANGCMPSTGEGCHPRLVFGWGCDGGRYSYHASQHWAFEPMHFDGWAARFGNYRFPNAKALHDYVYGRVYELTFYAPNDPVPLAAVAPFLDHPCEFDEEANPPILAGYSLSPAAMFHPDVMRSNSAGGWQDPWDLDHGFQSPGLFQAQYPDLKTHMIEHHWVQNRPADCNPVANPIWIGYECEPYYFNQGIDSTPVTLFYDGHVRLLPNTEVFAADQSILEQTGGVDGLWHRGTPFGEDGFFISLGFDGAPLSHHILTTDGILGRDTLADPPAADFAPKRLVFSGPKKQRPTSSVESPGTSDIHLITLEGEQP